MFMWLAHKAECLEQASLKQLDKAKKRPDEGAGADRQLAAGHAGRILHQVERLGHLRARRGHNGGTVSAVRQPARKAAAKG